MTEFGKYLDGIRHEADESFLDMSRKLNVCPSYLSKVCFGKMGLRHELLSRVCDTYGVSRFDYES